MITFKEFLLKKEELWGSKGFPPYPQPKVTKKDLYNSPPGGGGGGMPMGPAPKMMKKN